MNQRIVAALSLLTCLLCAVIAMTAGCSLKKQSPSKLRYLVEAQRPGEAMQPSAQTILRVRNLRVASPFEGRGFVYRNSDQNYESDFYHEFLVAPQSMLTEQVRQWLGASGRFRAVLDSASKLDATHSLEGDVTALYADFRDKAAPKAVLEIHFLLLSDHGPAPQIALQKSYRQEASVETRSPDAMARAWSAALAKMMAALEQDLAGGSVR
jgi:cholesterol transport system auxiliary component